jgi:hypothetical protein
MTLGLALNGAYRLMRGSPGEHAASPITTSTIAIRVRRQCFATPTLRLQAASGSARCRGNGRLTAASDGNGRIFPNSQ